jgi:hypothetical protein
MENRKREMNLMTERIGKVEAPDRGLNFDFFFSFFFFSLWVLAMELRCARDLGRSRNAEFYFNPFITTTKRDYSVIIVVVVGPVMICPTRYSWPAFDTVGKHFLASCKVIRNDTVS